MNNFLLPIHCLTTASVAAPSHKDEGEQSPTVQAQSSSFELQVFEHLLMTIWLDKH
jgi:hypothetical protein